MQWKIINDNAQTKIKQADANNNKILQINNKFFNINEITIKSRLFINILYFDIPK